MSGPSVLRGELGGTMGLWDLLAGVGMAWFWMRCGWYNDVNQYEGHF